MSLLIATPCYNGTMLTAYERSCYVLKKELTGTSFPHDFLRITNDSLITRARNVCASSFLYDTDFDCLLFIDSDIEFDPGDVARLWNLCFNGADVAVGHYRHKNPDAKDLVWVNGKLGSQLSDYSEPFKVTYAGTGFMMIRRQTFERLQQAHPEWEYEEGIPEEGRKDIQVREVWAFFQDPIEDTPQGRFHLSEDYFFCKRVQELGMSIVMDPAVNLKHWGWYPY